MPTFNRRDGLERVVRPLLADPATAQLVVVVDGCRDGSFELLAELARSDSRLEPVLIENSGEMGARQAGVERSRGEVVLLIDDDVLAEPGLVGGHARRHAGADGLVVVGYMPVAGAADRGPGRFATRLYAREYEGRCRSFELDSSEVLRHLWAGNLSLRREDCLRVGLPTDRFQERYHPDRELGLRFAKAGLRGEFDRSLTARHLHSRSLDGFLRDARSQGAGRLHVHRLHGDLVGQLPRDAFERNLPPGARRLVRASRRPRARPLLRATLRRLIVLAGRLRLYRLELAAAKLARRVEQQGGAITAAG